MTTRTRPKIKQTKHLTLRDRLSRLSYLRACQLLGPGGAELIRQLVLDNQVMLGSVNAARGHFQMAVDDLAQAHLRWGDHIAGLITNRLSRDQFVASKDQHQPDAIKEVIEWWQPERSK